MKTNSYEELIDIYVPNFRRFEETLWEENDAIIDIALLLRKSYDAWLLQIIWKYINFELGLCILKNKEIDEEKLADIINNMKNGEKFEGRDNR